MFVCVGGEGEMGGYTALFLGKYRGIFGVEA